MDAGFDYGGRGQEKEVKDKLKKRADEAALIARSDTHHGFAGSLTQTPKRLTPKFTVG